MLRIVSGRYSKKGQKFHVSPPPSLDLLILLPRTVLLVSSLTRHNSSFPDLHLFFFLRSRLSQLLWRSLPWRLLQGWVTYHSSVLSWFLSLSQYFSHYLLPCMSSPLGCINQVLKLSTVSGMLNNYSVNGKLFQYWGAQWKRISTGSHFKC